MKSKLSKNTIMAVSIGLAITSSLGLMSFATNTSAGRYMAGDFHNHTYLTDGNKSEAEVVKNAFEKFGLDWMANSEHGGTSGRTPDGNALVNPNGQAYDDKGKAVGYSMWRWMSLKDLSFPIIQKLQSEYKNKTLIQGVEWNVPTHEHASVSIASGTAIPVSNFEYMFDQGDLDTSRTLEGLSKTNTTHQDAVAGAKWLETNYKTSSYVILNHPSRKLKYSIEDIRDLNNAAPDVVFGMEGFPGHQKEGARGGYGSFSSDAAAKDYNKDLEKARTYGGADYMTAKVGGLWDALLGEGRNFWIFVNSDFHDNADDADFWPGEYGKSYTFVKDNNANGIVNGMRSGNSFAVQGDLINALSFTVNGTAKSTATMGETLSLKKDGKNGITITIKFKSPSKNNNNDDVKVNHIDLIAGNVTGKAAPGTDAYKKDTNASAKVLKSFTSKDWKVSNGWNVITYTLKNVDKSMYFRLRGTNLGINVPNETDKDGNPLIDTLVGENNSTKAYADLWFYSNPVFVSVK